MRTGNPLRDEPFRLAALIYRELVLEDILTKQNRLTAFDIFASKLSTYTDNDEVKAGVILKERLVELNVHAIASPGAPGETGSGGC